MRYGEHREEEPPVSVELRLLGGRTERAVEVCDAGDFGEPEGVWLPVSQIESIENDDGPVELDDLEHGDSATFEVKHWLAEREGWV